MSDQVTVNATWLAALGRENERLRDALLEVREAMPGTDDAAHRVQMIVSKALSGGGDERE